MTDKKVERRETSRRDNVDKLILRSQQEQQAKELAYVLRITDEDLEVISRHQEILTIHASGFAEVYYNYLFDNPDIADVLYTYERRGGDIGELVRAELKCMLDILTPQAKPESTGATSKIGRLHHERGVRPTWAVGAYGLFLSYLQKILISADIPKDERARLQSALIKLALRDMGGLLETYRLSSLDTLKRELLEITEQQGKAEDLLAGLPHLIWSIDTGRNEILYANYPLHALYPKGLEAPLPCLADTHTDDQQQLLTAWQEAVNGSTSCPEVRMSLAEGPQHWYRLSLHPTVNRRGRVVKVYCMLEDVNKIVSERKQLQELSTTDSLTSLPNRAMWNDHLKMALAASTRTPGSAFAVISLDINHFKMYNDTLGRETGDVLLHEIADRLNTIVRKSDSLARLGGDQFGILLQPVNDARTAAERVVSQVLDSFDIPFTHAGKQMCISVTLGVACFPEHGTSEEALLTSAESAMYRAKRNGLAYQFFDPGSDVSPAEQLRYSGQIRGALENNEFELYYQPQVDISSSRITGAEALLRWHHPLDGTVLPKRIIPVAEQLGMINPITDWVLVTALKQSRQWSYQGLSIPVSVNVSARSFQSPRLLDKIHWALEEAGVDGKLLEIEITEATLMLDLDRAASVLEEMSKTGVTIAIDDFGTGYSSLSYLKSLPIHTLKIDQSFIMDVAFDKQDVAIVRSIIDLGHNLGYKVVAEGVENSMAWDMLDTLGCDAAQGFHISKPLPEDNFSNWLSNPQIS